MVLLTMSTPDKHLSTMNALSPDTQWVHQLSILLPCMRKEILLFDSHDDILSHMKEFLL